MRRAMFPMSKRVMGASLSPGDIFVQNVLSALTRYRMDMRTALGVHQLQTQLIGENQLYLSYL
eukprot:3183892-Amphidinium_carterae.1